MEKLFALFATATTVLAGLRLNLNNAVSSNSTYYVSHKLYEFDSSDNYVFSDEKIVSNNIVGSAQIGKLTISGGISKQTTFRSDEAYGVNGGVSFSYIYNGEYQTGTNTDWNLIADTCTSIDDQMLTASVAKGAMIVQKSYDGDVWENAVNSVMNYYEDNKSGSSNFYTSAGEDISKGVYYRMIFAYELGRKTGESGALWWKEDVYEYKRYAEVYTCYVAIDTPSNVSFHNLSVEDSDLDYEGCSTELLSKGETLNNGDTTIKGFYIDTLGANYLIGVSKDGGSKTYVNSGYQATTNGRYEVTITSKLGSTATNTFYVFDGGDDNGFSTYFGDYFINGERVYRDGDYPTFAKNSHFHVNSVSENTPALTGQLINLTTGETTDFSGSDRSERNIELSAGTYFGEFFSGNNTSGSFYKYTVNFNIIDEDSKPYVNYNNLSKSSRLYDLASKHYEVAYQTTKGGYVFVCFSMESYDSAFQYAYEIEKRFIEKSSDGYLYYKSTENPNKKIKYIDNIELTTALNYYAKLNVEINYFNPLDSFTYNTYNDDLLNCLEDLNITDSIKVFPNSVEKEKLASRKPYVNDFTFISIGDYDSSKVTAKCYKNGKTYNIQYGIPLKDQLTLSSKYLITETNKYGKSISYDVYFVNDNQTVSSWLVSKNGSSQTINISSSSASTGTYSIDADSVSLLSISNSLDEDAIVTIKAPNVYSYEIKCSISELGDMALYKKGQYNIDFIDRVGNKYSISINISGNTRYSEIFTSTANKACYTDVYNNSHLNKKTMDEEILYDASELKAAIDRVVNKDLYTVSSYTNYCNCLKIAENVYKNPNATQAEINNATANLNAAYENLVLTADKTELHALLTKYENTDDTLYTSTSYSNLTKAYNDCMSVYLKDDPSEEEVNNAVNNLKNAFALLVKRGNKEALKDKLDSVSKIDCSLYTPKSLSALNEAYNSAYAIYLDQDATQTQIDNAIQLLEQFVGLLDFRADFSELLSEINKAQALNKDKYTKASWDVLVIQYNKALAVYKDFNNKQSDVNSAAFNLKQAIAALVECGNFEKLQQLVNEITSIDNRLYTSESIKNLKVKFDEAQAAISSNAEQATIDAIESELRQLKDALIIREDKVELKNKLEEVLALDQTVTSTDGHNNLASAYNEALEVLNDLDASEDEVQMSINKLNKAMNDVENKSNGGVKLEWWHYVLIALGGLVALVLIVFVFKLIF